MKEFLYRSVVYLRGKGASFGGSLLPLQMMAEGVYSLQVDTIRTQTTQMMDKDLSIFKDGSLDHLYVGPRVESLQNVKEFIHEGIRKLKLGGSLILHTKVGNHSPGVSELYPSMLEGWIGEGGKFQKKGEWEKDGQSLLIYKRIEGRKGVLPVKNKSSYPRVCVVRYGAIGDGIILTPLLRKLKEDGYHVTLNINPYCSPVFEGNPHIDNLLIQEKDAIPNFELGDYWKLWEGEYDRYINLSESLEGDLLIVEGRKEFFTHKDWRHQRCNKNYYDYTFLRAGYGEETYGKNGELFFTSSEERKMKEFFLPLKGTFNILWALNGSSHHKVYPMMEGVLVELFKRYPLIRCITVGDYMAKLLEFEHPSLIPKAGEWGIRESLLSTRYASLVIGPETAVTNASGCFSTPKIILLSHSSKENLTKYFENDFSLEPSQEVSPCYPCHQLHYSKESCPEGVIYDQLDGRELGRAPICSISISPTSLVERVEEVYRKFFSSSSISV